jgi:UDP-N-acetylglucosamine/UDP-N-acetylgalactosamine diphosphorylase
VRRPFFNSQEFGQLIFTGLLEKLSLAKKERMKRLQVLAEKAKVSSAQKGETKYEVDGRNEFSDKFSEIEALFAKDTQDSLVERYRDDFLSASEKAMSTSGASYIAVIQGLPADISAKGTAWLQRIVDTFCERANTIIPLLNIFSK